MEKTQNELLPVEQKALEASIAELDTWLETDGSEPLTQSQGESIMLVLHELKRLRHLAQQPLGWLHNKFFYSDKNPYLTDEHRKQCVAVYAAPVAAAPAAVSSQTAPEIQEPWEAWRARVNPR